MIYTTIGTQRNFSCRLRSTEVQNLSPFRTFFLSVYLGGLKGEILPSPRSEGQMTVMYNSIPFRTRKIQEGGGRERKSDTKLY